MFFFNSMVGIGVETFVSGGGEIRCAAYFKAKAKVISVIFCPSQLSGVVFYFPYLNNSKIQNLFFLNDFFSCSKKNKMYPNTCTV